MLLKLLHSVTQRDKVTIIITIYCASNMLHSVTYSSFANIIKHSGFIICLKNG